MSFIRRALVLSAVVVVAVGAALMLETPTTASPAHSSQQAGTAQSGPGSSALRLCYGTQTCVPANHPGSSGTVAPTLAYGFIGAVAVVLAGTRRRRRGPSVRPTPSSSFPVIFRPPIAS